MRVEIVIRDEQATNERFVRVPISLEALRAMHPDERKGRLDDCFLSAYYEMTGEPFSP